MNICCKITLAAILLAHLTEAQILGPRNTAKRKATDRANGRIDQSIDKGFDKVEEGMGGLFIYGLVRTDSFGTFPSKYQCRNDDANEDRRR
jgi:hypothetical protein